jgi:hypothetical protein
MRQKAIGFVVMGGAALALSACAMGRIADGGNDSGVTRKDGGVVNDGSTNPKDSGTTPKDSSTPIQDGSTCSFTVCGSLCVDTSQDDNNCGSCNNVCMGGSTCSNSTCVCSGGMTLCSNVCVDTMTDNSNCGNCNVPCSSNQTCTNGTCMTNSSGTPPQGNCSHSLCTANAGYLNPGCDPSGCVTNVCINDDYCCSYDWDSLCVSEVATYCPPYSCP